MNFLLNWVGTYTAPYFINPAKLGWSAKYGYIWFGSNMVLVLFVIFCLPETKDRTLEEIHEMFEAGVPIREFKNHICDGVEAYRAQGVEIAGTVLKEKDGTMSNITHV
jgi:hypothetical protein